MHFRVKSTLKSNHNHTLKHLLSVRNINGVTWWKAWMSLAFFSLLEHLVAEYKHTDKDSQTTRDALCRSYITRL
jgi:hypothetical protein